MTGAALPAPAVATPALRFAAVAATGAATLAAVLAPQEVGAVALVVAGGFGCRAAARALLREDATWHVRLVTAAFVLRAFLAVAIVLAGVEEGREGFLRGHDDRYWFAGGESLVRELARGAPWTLLVREGVPYGYLGPAHTGGTIPIGYPAVEALLLAAGGGLVHIVLLNAILASVAVPLTARLARQVGATRDGARVAALLVAVGEGMLWGAVNLREAWLVVGVTALAVLASRPDRPSPTASLLLGLPLLLALVLMRSATGAIAAVVVLTAWVATRRPGLVAQGWVLAALLGVAVVGIGRIPEAQAALAALRGGEADAGLLVLLGERLAEFRGNNDDAGTTAALLRGFEGDPLKQALAVMTIGLGTGVGRPPLIPGPDEYALFPTRFAWLALGLPLLAAAAIGIVRARHRRATGLVVGWLVALVVSAPMMGLFGPRYAFPTSGLEAAIAALGWPLLRAHPRLWAFGGGGLVALFLGYLAWKLAS